MLSTKWYQLVVLVLYYICKCTLTTAHLIYVYIIHIILHHFHCIIFHGGRVDAVDIGTKQMKMTEKNMTSWFLWTHLKNGNNDGCHQETCTNWCSKDNTSILTSNWAST